MITCVRFDLLRAIAFVQPASPPSFLAGSDWTMPSLPSPPMMNCLSLLLGSVVALALAAPAAGDEPKTPPVEKLPPATSRPIDFLKDIRPILVRSCHACHGPAKQRGRLR